MKKILSLILVLMMVLALGACSGNTSESSDTSETEVETETIIPATIIDNEGNEVQMTFDELNAVEDENAAKFNKLYRSAEITITGTVESVDAYLHEFSTGRKEVYEIKLEEGWRVMVLQEFHDEVIDLSRGEKIEVKSVLYSTDYTVYYIGQLGSEWFDRTVITVL